MTRQKPSHRRKLRLMRAESKRAQAEAAYRATKSHVWLARLRDLTTKCLRLA
jgi:hypothetical protein